MLIIVYAKRYAKAQLWFRFLSVENHIAENTALGRQGSWRENCNPGGLCGRGNRGADMWWAMCDTSNSKKNDPDYCGQCKYGFKSPMGEMGPIDVCCTFYDFLRRNVYHCLCQAEYAPNCPVALSASGEKSNFYSIKPIV